MLTKHELQAVRRIEQLHKNSDRLLSRKVTHKHEDDCVVYNTAQQLMGRMKPIEFETTLYQLYSHLLKRLRKSKRIKAL